MTERRFNEAEVAAIFERATNAPQTSQHAVSSGEGMTLAQLQEIGREVGILPDVIRDAAHAVSHSGTTTSRTVLGLPLGVGRTIELGRKLTDDEWERLVVDLRETFDARGSVRSDGSLKQWTNGNLHALLEPTASGHRLRIRTVKGQSLRLMVGGVVVLGVATFSLFGGLSAGAGEITQRLMSAGGIAALGAVMIGFGAALLPNWARERRRQMEDVAARLTAMTSSQLTGPAAAPDRRT